MSSTIINKGISKLVLNSPGVPTDEDFIRGIDYDELERKYRVHKYYPQFVHNELSTPSLKKMIADKPIYGKANEHLTKEQKREQMKELKRAYTREQKQIREREKLYKKKDKVANRWCNGESHQRRASKPEQGLEDTRNSRQMGPENLGGTEGQCQHDTMPHDHARHQLKHEMVFRNPFDSNQSTLIEDDPTSSAVKTHRQNSIAGKLMNFLKGRLDEESTNDNKLELSKSYDQTKSAMTSTRTKPQPHGLKTKINELSNRRYTDLGMYFINCETTMEDYYERLNIK